MSQRKETIEKIIEKIIKSLQDGKDADNPYVKHKTKLFTY
jgi:hypothetical protein